MLKNLFNKSSRPNNFTLAMGKLIREARNEAGMSQAKLARETFMRQATISDMENGKVEPSASELTYLSFALGKPILYFFPKRFVRDIDTESLSIELQEVLKHARRLSDDEIKKVVVLIRSLADYEDREVSKAVSDEHERWADENDSI